MADPTSRPSHVVVEVATVGLPGAAHIASAPGAAAGAAGASMRVAPATELVYPLRDRGAPGLAAVSVVASGAPVAVAEIVSGPGAPIEAACALGTGTAGALAPGSTAGGSSELLSLFDPIASPAVVEVRLAGGGSASQPAALQGVTVAARSLVVVDLGRFAVQRPSAAVAVVALSGRVVVGSLGHLASASAGTADFLAVGSGAPRRHWILSPGPVGPGRTVALSILDPTPEQASVTVTLSFLGHPAVRVAARVPAEQAVSVSVPIPTGYLRPPASGRAAAKGSAKARAGSTGFPARGSAGLVVRAGALSVEAGGAGVVVARLSTLSLPGATSETSVASPACAAAAKWVLAGGTTGTVSDELLVADASKRSARVELYELAQSAGGASDGAGGASAAAGAATGLPGTKSMLASFVVPEGGSVLVNVGPAPAGRDQFGLEVESSVAVVAEQLFVPRPGARGRLRGGGRSDAVPGPVSTVTGIPASG